MRDEREVLRGLVGELLVAQTCIRADRGGRAPADDAHHAEQVVAREVLVVLERKFRDGLADQRHLFGEAADLHPDPHALSAVRFGAPGVRPAAGRVAQRLNDVVDKMRKVVPKLRFAEVERHAVLGVPLPALDEAFPVGVDEVSQGHLRPSRKHGFQLDP